MISGTTVPVEGNVVYAGEQENLFDRCYDNVKTPEDVDDSHDYVIVDHNYQFATMENYEKIGTYITPLILAVKNMNIPSDASFTYDDFITAVGIKNEWSEIGIKSLNMDTVESSIPYDHQLIANILNKDFGSATENSFWNYSSKRLNDDVVNIIWKPNLAHMEGYREINTNVSSNKYLVFDVYKNKNYDSEETFEIPYMTKIDNDSEIIAGQDYRDVPFRDKWDNPYAGQAVLYGIVSLAIFLMGFIWYCERRDYY